MKYHKTKDLTNYSNCYIATELMIAEAKQLRQAGGECISIIWTLHTKCIEEAWTRRYALSTPNEVAMMKMVRVLLVASVMLFASAAFADEKSDLYRKGIAAVNAGDTISAADAFCTSAKIDSGYLDATAQCATYKPLAERTLSRYKITYVDGLSAMQAGDYATAQKKFENVKGGQFAEQAKEKLAEIAILKHQDLEEGKANLAQLLHIGDSGAMFEVKCAHNRQFDERSSNEIPSLTSYFCAGWIKGATQESFGSEGKRVEGSCPPIELTIGQETQLLLQYIKDHPERKDSSAALLLKSTLQKAFPCERAKK
jgi:hypothetical protein